MLNLEPHFFVATAMTLLFSLITAFFYHRRFLKRDIAVAVVLYSLFIFFIVYFISFENSIGLGIGLLGILSLIRLRSTPENLIDIAYVFYAITLGLLNASIQDLSMVLVIDIILSAVLFVIVSGFIFRKQIAKTEIVFDEIVIDTLNNAQLLKEKIMEVYKINPIDIRIEKINYLKDSVTLIVTYDANSN